MGCLDRAQGERATPPTLLGSESRLDERTRDYEICERIEKELAVTRRFVTKCTPLSSRRLWQYNFCACCILEYSRLVTYWRIGAGSNGGNRKRQQGIIRNFF
jgi:hypothetical protein